MSVAHESRAQTAGEQEMKARLADRFEACLARARLFHAELPRPGLWFDLRGRSAGQAHYGRGGLRFNMILYREQPETFLAEVVPHEMAHWFVHHTTCRRVRPHGPEWQRAMIELYGLPPRVTHRFDTRNASPAPYQYRCGCRIHHFTRRRHLNARRGSRYRCRHCGATLDYRGQAPGA